MRPLRWAACDSDQRNPNFTAICTGLAGWILFDLEFQESIWLTEVMTNFSDDLPTRQSWPIVIPIGKTKIFDSLLLNTWACSVWKLRSWTASFTCLILRDITRDNENKFSADAYAPNWPFLENDRVASKKEDSEEEYSCSCSPSFSFKKVSNSLFKIRSFSSFFLNSILSALDYCLLGFSLNGSYSDSSDEERKLLPDDPDDEPERWRIGD